MIRIGLTGGIGSGKTVVSSLLKVYAIPVYIADIESKKLTNTSPVIKGKLMEAFGSEIYQNDELNKKLLANYIFNDPEKLKLVNSIIHPEVKKDFEEWSNKQNTPFCVIESAILFESGFDSICDCTIMVYAPEATRIERVEKRDQLSVEDIRKRIANQLSDQKKREQADYIITNDGKQALIPQVEKLLLHLQ